MNVKKSTVVISTLLILLPIVPGLLLWNQLPEQMATHFDINGVPDRFSGKAFTIFAIPLFLALLQLICLVSTRFDLRSKRANPKLMKLMLCVVPVISIFVFWMLYSFNLGYRQDMTTPTMLLFGILFLFVGNWMPKVRQNLFVGIRLPWTLTCSEEVWDRIHRFAGKVWVVCSLVLLADVFVGFARKWVLLVCIVAICVLPIAYSIVAAWNER